MSKSPEFLVLFDIDGTIMHSGGAGRKALEQGFTDIYSKQIDLKLFDFRGRTDISIARDILSSQNLEFDPNDLLRMEWMKRYEFHIEKFLQETNPYTYPGIIELLTLVSKHPNAGIGLVTGNAKRGAFAKLKSVEADYFFPFGGYGEDGEIRADILRQAINRATDFYSKNFPLDKTVLIGDACSDIEAAKTVGVISVAVATGGTDKNLLQSAGPDFLQDDFSEPQKFLELIGL